VQALPHRLVIARDITRTDHNDVIVGEKVERRRVVCAGNQHERPCFGHAAKGMADGIEVVSVAATTRYLKGRFRPRHGGEARIRAHAKGRRQIVIAQINRCGLGHISGFFHEFHRCLLVLSFGAKQRQQRSAGHLPALRNQALRGTPDALIHRLDADRLGASNAKRTTHTGEDIGASGGNLSHFEAPFTRDFHCA
jgi:hypothetical protein